MQISKIELYARSATPERTRLR